MDRRRTAIDRAHVIPRPDRHAPPRRCAWETPAFEEVGVSAEVTAYVGVWELDRPAPRARMGA